MDNLALLFSENDAVLSTRVEIRDGKFVYRQKESVINANSLRVMIRFVNTLQIKYPKIKLPILFELGGASFFDKLTYIMFECLCAYLIENCGYRVRIVFAPQTKIHTAGIASSPLLLLTTGRDEHIDKFKKTFKFELYKNHFRRVLTKQNLGQPDFLCRLMDDVAYFQTHYGVDTECREAISEVVVELIGNASEHGDSNCLVDFDIAPSYYRAGSEAEFFGLNLAVVNFSDLLLGSALEAKIKNSDTENERYKVVRKAYDNHERFFNDRYTEADFFNLTAFQHKVSGRKNSLTGGTGLTKLIESLETRSETHMCYVQSGRRILSFRPEFLSYNDDGWLGFNTSNDYISTIPQVNLFSEAPYFLPGTAYNLNFVVKKEI